MSDGKVDVIQTVPMPAFAADRLAELFTVHHPWQADDADRFYGDVRDKVRGVATSGPGPLDRAFMDKLPKLEIIANFAVGVDAVDLDAAREKKIIVTNTPDVLTDCVADFAMGMVIAVMRRVAEGDRYVRAGRWATKGDLTLATSLRGKTLGIIGLGRIGKAVARRAEAFGMTIAYHGRNPQADVDYAYHAAPAALAAASDCLALTCPGGPGTYHLVDAAVLRALGPKSFLVNAARGSVVHEAALIEALTDGVIAGAALDVFDREPLPEDSPLWELDNVILTPHISGGNENYNEVATSIFCDNLRRYLAGEELHNIIDPDRGY